ncbi:MAG: ECF transporter S component [Syntrophothermus sp.]
MTFSNLSVSDLSRREKLFHPDRHDLVLASAGALLYFLVGLAGYFAPTGSVIIKPAAAVLIFFGTLFGPVVGFAAGLFGGFLLDLALGSIWLHWNVGTGIIGLIAGLQWLYADIDKKKSLEGSDIVNIALFTVLGSFIGMFFAGIVDLFLGAPAAIALLDWAIPAAISNAVFGVVFGPLLIHLYKIYNARTSARTAAKTTPRRTIRRMP